MLLSTGERISCALCAMAIHDMGHKAISLTGSQAGIVTDSSHTRARIIDVRADRIREALEDDRIVLVAGFQGVSTDSRDVTTLGRGGSDTTAVALAAALGAAVCEIYTDVSGVFSADPRIVPDARKLATASYEEMLEMSASGAKVLQLRSVEYARNHGVRIHCRSSFEDGPGTLVVSEQESRRRRMEQPFVTAVTHSDGEARVTLTGVRDEPGVAGRIFTRARRCQRQRRRDHPERAGGRRRSSPTSRSRSSAPTWRPRPTRSPASATQPSVRTDERIGKVSIVGAGMRSPPRRRRPGLRGARRGGDQHRDDLHLADQDLLRDLGRPRPRRGPGAARGVRARRRRDPPEDPTGAEHRPTVTP